jgi:hypothetical protein
MFGTMSEPNFSEPFQLDVNSLPLTNADSIEPVYSNNVSLAIAPWDIRLIFSEVVVGSKPGEAVNELRANIAMNPGHTKVLASALVQVISAYERQYGEIKMPGVPQGITAAQSAS